MPGFTLPILVSNAAPPPQSMHEYHSVNLFPAGYHAGMYQPHPCPTIAPHLHRHPSCGSTHMPKPAHSVYRPAHSFRYMGAPNNPTSILGASSRAHLAIQLLKFLIGGYGAIKSDRLLLHLLQEVAGSLRSEHIPRRSALHVCVCWCLPVQLPVRLFAWSVPACVAQARAYALTAYMLHTAITVCGARCLFGVFNTLALVALTAVAGPCASRSQASFPCLHTEEACSQSCFRAESSPH
jgi:hypothetical protein